MGQLPSNGIPQNPFTAFVTPPSVSRPISPVSPIGTDWGRFFRNLLIGGAGIFVAAAALSVSLSVNSEKAVAREVSQPAAVAPQIQRAQTHVENPRIERPSSRPANPPTAWYPTHLRNADSAFLSESREARPAAPRPTAARNNPNVALLPDPDF